MTEFAKRTGLSPESALPRRYLWTDAFAVCNFLELYRQTHDEHFKSLAIKLVHQVHYHLGRHRQDDQRTGWISGLDASEGIKHPTAGGLRIGKKMNERSDSDPLDENLEWDRDGQYYHYLTKWMHALNCVSLVTPDPIYRTYALELAKAVHTGFVYDSPSADHKRIHWKMSIDLSRPLVPSMGHHDPLDGYITYQQLQAGATDSLRQRLDLTQEIIELEKICRRRTWVTNDPLGIGGLLIDAYKVAQIIADGCFRKIDLLETMLDSALQGLDIYAGSSILIYPAAYRLAFRELGLVIGMHAVDRMSEQVEEQKECFANVDTLRRYIEKLMVHRPLIVSIEKFWLDRTNRKADTWTDHLDINMIMLATSLAPDCFLKIGSE
jgi:hypothetical protein